MLSSNVPHVDLTSNIHTENSSIYVVQKILAPYIIYVAHNTIYVNNKTETGSTQ